MCASFAMDLARDLAADLNGLLPISLLAACCRYGGEEEVVPETIGEFESNHGVVQMLFDSNTRGVRKISPPGADFAGLMATMRGFKAELPNPGQVPTKLYVVGETFSPTMQAPICPSLKHASKTPVVKKSKYCTKHNFPSGPMCGKCIKHKTGTECCNCTSLPIKPVVCLPPIFRSWTPTSRRCETENTFISFMLHSHGPTTTYRHDVV